MLHLGDITKIKGAEIPVVDVITGGSPCQDLSVAGKRAGLEGERSGLFMEQIRIIKEMREHDKSTGRRAVDIRPRYMVWENVDGARSSGNPKGEDFRIVLEETARIADPDATIPRPEKWAPSGCILGDGWSIAWRLHDAQFWGVAQRRRRIALVADFGGLSAPEILFERAGLCRDTCEGEPQGKDPSVNSRDGSDSASYTLKVRGGADIDSHGRRAGKGALIQNELSGTLGVSQDQSLFAYGFDPGASRDVGVACYKETSKEITNGTCPGHHNGIAFGISSYDSYAMKSDNPESGFYSANTSRTLDTNGGNPACNQGGVAVVQDTTGPLMASGYDKLGTQEAKSGMYVVDMGGEKSGCNVMVDNSPTLSCTHGGEPVVALEGNGARPSHLGTGYSTEGVSFTLNTTETHGIAYGIDRSAYNQGKDAKYDFTIAEESSPTLVARGGGRLPLTANRETARTGRCQEDMAETILATDYKDMQYVVEEKDER